MNEQVVLNKASFSKKVEYKVRHNREKYLDAIINTCTDFNIEPEDCKKYLKPDLVSKLHVESAKINLVEIDSCNVLDF